jgi:DNA polymerase III psi subunit
MNKNYSFLPLLIEEKIYPIDEPTGFFVEQKIEEEEKPVPTPPKEISYQGKNNKQVVILVDQPEAEYTTVEQDLLLRNILTAMQLNLQDIALVNAAHNDTIDMESLKKVGCSKLIGFGINAARLAIGAKFETNTIIENKGISFLFSYSLNELQHDKEKKMTLWRSLKALFNL